MAALKIDLSLVDTNTVTGRWSDDKPLEVVPKLCSGFGQHHTNEPTDDPGKQKTRKPYADITFNEIKRMVDNPDRVDKSSAQWLIPSTLKSRNFKEQEKNGKYWLLWLDFDDVPPALDEIKKHLIDIIGDVDFEVYNTASATKENPKCRALIPLHQWLKFEDWTRCQQILNDKFEELGIIPDRANQRAAQLCYLPNRGRFYHSINQRNNNFLNPLERFKAEFLAIGSSQEAEQKRTEAMRKVTQEKRASLQYDGSDDGLINAFNQSYTVEEILLRNGYKQRGLTFCHPDSTTGNYAAAIKPETGRVHTFSEKDPLYVEGSQSGHDAFSCFEILEHGGDTKDALIDAGDNHLTIDGESWNTVRQREYMQAQAAQKPSNINVSNLKPLKIVDVAELLNIQFPEREGLLGNVFTLNSLNMIYAGRGVGKTHFALGTAYAMAAGSSFFGWEAKRPAKVLYIDGEMPGNSLQERLQSIAKTADRQPESGFLQFLTIDLNDGKMPDISTIEGQESMEEACQQAEVIVLDNLSCLARSGRENEAESWTVISEWAMRMRSEGKCVIFIHHAGKGGQQRGTSKREDILDVVINLKHPVDYEPSQGARFIVEFQKARHLQGDEVKPFEAQLNNGEWTTVDVEQSNFDKVVELAKEGLKQADIAEELELNKSTVSRHMKKAKRDGLLSK